MNGRGRERVKVLCLAAVAVWAVSCSLDVPMGNVYSISKVLLPSPSVVIGDTMRDSAGNVAPLRVQAFSVTGDSVAGTVPNFIALDTFAHLASGAKLVGDKIGLARIVGGIGNVQTLPETVKVTLKPDTIVGSDSTHHVTTYKVLADSVANSAELGVLVQNRSGATPATVDGVIVKYAITYRPPSKTSIPAVTFFPANLANTRDTTSSGRAGRSLRLRINNLQTVNDDSAIVTATASYRGLSIGTVKFIVVFKNQ